MIQSIPLYHFFTLLRSHNDFSLGLEEYFSLIEVFQKDNSYQTDAQKLLNLCRFLWLKPGQSENPFKANKIDLPKEEEKQTTEKHKEKRDKGKESPENKLNNEKNKPMKEEKNQERDKSFDAEPEALYLNIVNEKSGQATSTTSDEDILKPYNIHLLEEHVILKERQLKQRWRTLKKTIDGQANNQLNIPASIQQLTTFGRLLQPVYQKEKLNKARLITLVDNQGSMIAFKGITKALIQTAEKGSKINNTVFYFKNLPRLDDQGEDFYIYHSPAHTKYSTLVKELKQHLHKYKDLALLLISDGGAAKGQLNLDRLQATIELLQVLKQHSFKIAWLNPIPQDRWKMTTASLIQDFVPMFETSEQGLKSAIDILRGKVPANSELFYEDIF